MLNKLQAICDKYEELCARSEQPDFYADPQKAWEEMGWKAQRGIEDMCASSWKWQSMNPNGYKS